MIKKFTYILSGIILLFCLLLQTSCKRDPFPGYQYNQDGYFFKLLAFQENKKQNNNNTHAYIAATFSTIRDSVFWSSTVDFSNKLIIPVSGQGQTQDMIEAYIRQANEGDSASLLVPAGKFFNAHFYSDKLPSFMLSDTLVKINLKVMALLSDEQIDSLHFVWESHEKEQMDKYISLCDKENCYKDSMHVYWLEGLPDTLDHKGKNKTVSVIYKGYLLNLKQFDESPRGWVINTAVPDQCLPGINYVIKRMDKGQNVKIILPSYLAFGEKGSGKIIPPFSPIVYEISINDLSAKK